MRIGLDVHVLTGPHQGTTSVWLNLLSELPPTSEYLLYSFDPDDVRRRFPQPYFIHRRIPRVPAAARIQLAFPLIAGRDRCDALHMNYYGPLVGSPPVVRALTVLEAAADHVGEGGRITVQVACDAFHMLGRARGLPAASRDGDLSRHGTQIERVVSWTQRGAGCRARESGGAGSTAHP